MQRIIKILQYKTEYLYSLKNKVIKKSNFNLKEKNFEFFYSKLEKLFLITFFGY